MAPPLYIGVAGVTSRAQADDVLLALPLGFPRQIAIGVLASAKTLAGGERNPRSPAPEQIAGIFPDDARALNLVHYFTRTTGDGLVEQLREAMHFGGPRCHGIQVNVCWPSPIELAIFRGYYEAERIVLQVGPAAIAVASVDPQKIADRLRPYVYDNAITDVLIDPSGGAGVRLGREWILRVLDTLVGWAPDLGITIAGGFSPVRLPDRDLLRTVSIDVESGVRDGSDALDNSKVRAFLAACNQLLTTTEGT